MKTISGMTGRKNNCHAGAIYLQIVVCLEVKTRSLSVYDNCVTILYIAT